MSAGRIAGDNLDRYDTPVSGSRPFLNAWPHEAPRFVVEPAAGNGKLLREIEKRWPHASTIGFDIAPRGSGIIEKDWLGLLGSYDELPGAPDLIITNPPFRLAEQFLRASMGQTKRYVALLLRAAFLESDRRKNLLEEFPPSEIFFLRKRPRFTGPNSDGGSDTAMYAWFVWTKGERPDHFKGYVL